MTFVCRLSGEKCQQQFEISPKLRRHLSLLIQQMETVSTRHGEECKWATYGASIKTVGASGSVTGGTTIDQLKDREKRIC